MEARDPFSEDSSLRIIVTGVIADNRVNVDKAKEVGQNILKTMTHKNTDEYSFKGELQRQNKLISFERPFKILQNETKIIKIG